nr:hypothetical protein [Alphaproteobacteria bacterium]
MTNSFNFYKDEENNVILTTDNTVVGQISGLCFKSSTTLNLSRPNEKDFFENLNNFLFFEFQKKINDIYLSTQENFSISDDGAILFKNESIGNICKGQDNLHPQIMIKTHNSISTLSINKISKVIDRWLEYYLNEKLFPLYNALKATKENEISAYGRGILFQLTEHFGTMPRNIVQDMIEKIKDEDRKRIAKIGIRFGYNYLFFPLLLKPSAQRICTILWKVWNEKLSSSPELKFDGKMSIDIDKKIHKQIYNVQGYILAGRKAIRVDIMERFSAKLREVTRINKNELVPLPPELLSLAGLKKDEISDILLFLGFKAIIENDQIMIRVKYKNSFKKNEHIVLNEDSPFAALANLKK